MKTSDTFKSTATANNGSSSSNCMTLRSSCDGRSCSQSPQLSATKSRISKSVAVLSPLALFGNSAEHSSRGSAKVVHFEQFHHHHHHHHNHNHQHHTLGDQKDGVSFASYGQEVDSRSGESNNRRSSRSRSSSVVSLDDSSVVCDRVFRDSKSSSRQRRGTTTKTVSSSASSSVASSYQEALSEYEEETNVNLSAVSKNIHLVSFFNDIAAVSSSSPRFTGNVAKDQESLNTLDLSDKSDYSYSKSFDYVSGVTPTRPCPNPSMTRERSYLNSTFSASSTRSNGSVSSSFHRHHIVKNSFGLDSDSDDDDGGNHHHPKTVKRFQRSSQQQSTYEQIFTNLLSFKNFVASTAVGKLLFKLFSLFYCFFSSVHMFDTWLLLFIRSVIKKTKTFFILWLIPFLLMFLCFGGGSYFPEEYTKMPFHVLPSSHVSENLSSKLQLSSYFTDGLFFARDFVSGLSSWFVLKGEEINPTLMVDRRGEKKRLTTSDLHETESQITSRESELPLNSDLYVVDPKLIFEREGTDPQITSHNSSIEQSHILRLIKDELEKTRMTDKSDTEQKTKEQMNLYSRLERLLIRLEEKVVKLENAHAALALNIRNCCRNHTEYSEMIELQISQALKRIFSDDDKGADVREADGGMKGSLNSFKNWISTQFVSKDTFDDELARRSNVGLTENMRFEIEALAKAVATAVVAKQLESYESPPFNPSQPMTEASIETDSKSTVDVTDEATVKSTVISTIDEAFVMSVVQNALHLYNADKTGMADFALETAGGSVLSTRCSETYQTGTAQISIFGVPLWYITNSPRIVIQSGVQPGECWAFKGSQGYLVIQLSATIKPTAFSIEHIPRSLSTTGNINSAPREFKVLGLQHETDTNGVLLGEYAFDENGESLQFFIVKDQDVGSYRFIELQIENNHGHPDYTCLYRFRVHGIVQNT